MTSTKGAAIVTGAVQGIGLAIARQLANDGFAVVLNDLELHKEKLTVLESELKKDGGRALALTGDVTVEATVQNIIQRSVAEFGHLEVVRLGDQLSDQANPDSHVADGCERWYFKGKEH
jgi:NAD(P)-dependent dehydrogenase (short-subunit alcohol dehydrogenase family)